MLTVRYDLIFQIVYEDEICILHRGATAAGLRIKQNLLEPECLVSTDRNKKSPTEVPSIPVDLIMRGNVQNVIQSTVGCIRRTDSGLPGNGVSVVRSTSGKHGLESCYYEHFIYDYRLQGSNVTPKSSHSPPLESGDQLGSVKPRKTKFPALAYFTCEDCGRCYRSKTSLGLHKRLECGKEPTFQCPYCPLKTHQKGNLNVHIKKKHMRSDDESELNGDRSYQEGGGHSLNLNENSSDN